MATMKRFLFGLAALVVATAAYAAYTPIPLLTTPATNEASQINSTLNGIINSLNANINPATFAQLATPRNLLDNGQMQVAQRGTGTVTCAQAAAITSAAYTADRWGCSGNVTSGAGNAAVATATPTPPAGYTQEVKLWRASAALTQPLCLIQEVPTAASVAASGQVVTLSANIAGLAGLVADNGGVVNMTVITGTTADEGFGTMTASPAITPAWTGLATVATQAFTVTTTFSRVSMNAQIGATAKEVGVLICFTPTATGAGATDGFAVTGTQLEIGNTPSAFEFHSIQQDTAIAQRYFFTITESATSGAQQSASGQGATTTTCQLYFPFPVTMRAAPTFYALGTALSTGTWTITHVATATALATTYLVVLGANTPNAGSLTGTVASGLTAGQTCALTSANGGSILAWSADF
jgi:hypothetical protein